MNADDELARSFNSMFVDGRRKPAREEKKKRKQPESAQSAPTDTRMTRSQSRKQNAMVDNDDDSNVKKRRPASDSNAQPKRKVGRPASASRTQTRPSTPVQSRPAQARRRPASALQSIKEERHSFRIGKVDDLTRRISALTLADSKLKAENYKRKVDKPIVAPSGTFAKYTNHIGRENVNKLPRYNSIAPRPATTGGKKHKSRHTKAKKVMAKVAKRAHK